MLIRSFEEGTTLTERVVWKADLENEELSSVSRKLNTISRSNVEQIEVLVKKAQILGEIWQSMLEEPEEMIKALIPVIRAPLAQGHPGLQFGDTDLESLLDERIRTIDPLSEPTDPEAEPIEFVGGVSSQRRMRIADEGFEFHNYFEILIITANWLIRKGKLRTSDCPLVMGPRRNFVNTQPRHRYGKDFVAPEKLSNGLWIETVLSASGCIYNAKKLLGRFGYSPDMLVIEQ